MRFYKLQLYIMFKYSKAFSSFSGDNLQKAKTFYSEVLELKVVELDMGLLSLEVTEAFEVIVYPKADHVPATFTVLNFSVEDVDTSVNMLTEKGIVFEQYGGAIKTNEKGISRGNGGPAIAWFKDPAGNILSVLQES